MLHVRRIDQDGRDWIQDNRLVHAIVGSSRQWMLALGRDNVKAMRLGALWRSRWAQQANERSLGCFRRRASRRHGGEAT